MNKVEQSVGWPIEQLERHRNWQATAQYRGAALAAVLKGRPGSDFEGMFYLYNDGWLPPHPAAGGMPAHSAGDIRSMFESGELLLIRGAIPK